jgi:A/G-specific adenine glycosylase
MGSGYEGTMARRRPSIGSSELRLLLAWYDRERRRLPWRAGPGEAVDPYRVWLSEVMLQQTTVAAVAPYFERFLARWPTVGSLAAAPLEDVLAAWAGLGYYARARRLHACAREVVARHGGRFPRDPAELRDLPGIGAYTAAAIAAIAFQVPVVPLDGNVLRVLARVFALAEPPTRARARLGALAAGLAPETRPGDVAQALMDLGATVCTPRRPACPRCPWERRCAARARGIAEGLPVPAPKPERPTRHGVAFWLAREDGAVLLRRRPAEGLLGGMLEVPTTPWRANPWPASEAARHAPTATRWEALPGEVVHVFTHFRLVLAVWRATGAASGTWHRPEAFAGLALPTLMRKVARHALGVSRTPPRSGRRSGDRRTAPAPAP